MASDNNNNSAKPSDLKALKKRLGELKGELKFGEARQLLETALLDAKLLQSASKAGSKDVWLKQQLALCTYKDEGEYPETRLKQALEVLESIDLREERNKDAETLALGGAVYKRLWEFKGQLDHLYESLEFYRAAFERNPEQDMGYGGVNAAYLLDVLAARSIGLEKRSGLKTKDAARLRKQAQDLRGKIKQRLSASLEKTPQLAKEYWFMVTIGEACFGLGQYAEAGEWLTKARAAGPKEWEMQTTFQQWVNIARQQGIQPPAEQEAFDNWHQAWKTLANLLGPEETADALTCYRGKVGLALSGGGFRAAFFHLGVLARLAEVDALRGVDVLSTVSGGSILGAQYYLEVQRMLEDSGNQLDRAAYLQMVAKLQKDFLLGVESNIRMRAFADFADNLRMLSGDGYSRSHKLGELYESELYSKVKDGKGDKVRTMPDLLVQPKHGKYPQNQFKPKFHNWRRRAKVPVLLLNTTSLNSGHNWFFTASWMGEPPGLLDIDCNERYRRLYYWQAPQDKPELQKFRLGYAAAASSCVPGLFEPLVLDGLYQDRTLKLVDGGVHDNQGAQGLLDEGCTLIFCSDASGQMGDVHDPADDPAGVLLRTVSVLQDRVREAEYQDLLGRLDSGALQGVFFIHTQKDLVPKPLDWLPGKIADDNDRETTSYGIARDLQRKIAGIRTDLDSFTEVEANALMASGYLMTEQQLKDLNQQHQKHGKPGTWGGFDIHAPRLHDWEFLKLQPLLEQLDSDNPSPARQDLGKQLQVGSGLAFKVWKLIPQLKIIAAALALVAVWGLAKLVIAFWNSTLFSLSVGGLILAIAGVAGALVVPALGWLNPKQEAGSIVIKAAIALSGYFLAKLHLHIFDKLFLKRGRLQRLLNLK